MLYSENTTKVVANLREGDLVFVVFHDRLPIPEVDALRVISLKNWETLRCREKPKGTGWLIIESDLFKLINSIQVLERATQPISNNFLINLTLLEIERNKQKRWCIFGQLSYLCMKLKNLRYGISH